jgi:hypothetical protein
VLLPKRLAMVTGVLSNVNDRTKKMGQVGFYFSYRRIFVRKILACRLFFRRGIAIGIPSAAFQFEAACGKYFLGLIVAFGTLNRFGIHPHQLFGNMTTLALEFVNRHHSFLSGSGSLCKRLDLLQSPIFKPT